MSAEGNRDDHGARESRPKAGAVPPFAPVTLVLAKDPAAEDASASTTLALDALAREGNKEEAHRLVDPLIGEPARRGALASFYLRDLAGRRGARLLLRWLREDERADEETRVFVAGAREAVECWCQLRLFRTGRALRIARRAVPVLAQAEPGERDRERDRPDTARAWAQALEAIRRCSLRRGNLRQALVFHELAEELERAHPGCLPAAERAHRAMTAVAYLLDQHREHGLPASAARYLARSLGHPDGDSDAAYAELVTDLSVLPEHVAKAKAIAERFGFADQLGARLDRMAELCFRGNWKTRRRLQQAGILLVYVTLTAVGLLGLVLLTHLFQR
ncbi:MAG: hypothetical protein ABI333_23880 [bacterium]